MYLALRISRAWDRRRASDECAPGRDSKLRLTASPDLDICTGPLLLLSSSYPHQQKFYRCN